MPNTLLFGAYGAASVYRYDQSQLTDGATPVTLRATTTVWAPNGWWGEALWRTLTLVVDANVGCTLRLTAILADGHLDGTLGNPDTRVTFTLATPAAGERTQRRVDVGLWYPLTVLGTQMGVVGLRGTFVSFQLDSIGSVVLPTGETNPDLRFDACELDVEPLLQTGQVVNA